MKMMIKTSHYFDKSTSWGMSLVCSDCGQLKCFSWSETISVSSFTFGLVCSLARFNENSSIMTIEED